MKRSFVVEAATDALGAVDDGPTYHGESSIVFSRGDWHFVCFKAYSGPAWCWRLGKSGEEKPHTSGAMVDEFGVRYVLNSVRATMVTDRQSRNT